jgi:3-phenylpropionate/trans-cinnamate dioxygenase ferredoxin reductase subunit
MEHYQYLIIGGGMTADAAVRGIRELDGSGSIGLISREPDAPYARPLLSKGLWKGRPLEKVWRHTEELGANLVLDRKVVVLDPKAKIVRDDAGDDYAYDKLLLATGGRPIRLPFGDDQIIYYRNLRDYRRLREMTEQGEHFVVIGSGFIGSEIAAALAMNQKKVSMIFLEEAIGANVYPAALAHFLNNYYKEKGVELIPGDSVASVERDGRSFVVRTGSGRAIETDGVVAGIGIRPNVELAESAGLEIRDGIMVDAHLRTSAADIYAAGDVARFYNPALGKQIRVEHEDNALNMGKQAGRIMAGDDQSYTHLPSFYSDLFDLGYEAVGELDSQLQIVQDWKEPFKEGVVYYLGQKRVRGVLLWNVWKQVGNARELIADQGPLKGDDLIGRIPV